MKIILTFVYGVRIKGTAYPVYLFGSIGVGDIRASVIVSVAVAVLFFLMWVLLSHSFLQIATSTGKVIHREYREKHNRQRSIDAALLGREFSRFTASPNYMLNCGLVSMNFMTAPSVSLEGKSLWLLQSLQCKRQITCNIGRIIDGIRKDDMGKPRLDF